MKHLTTIAVAGLLAATVLPASAADITGAGSTFVYPVLAKWADVYKKDTGIGLNYQSIGSGGGIKQITNKTVTFGASDMPLTPEDVAKNNFVQFPVINGSVVPLFEPAGHQARRAHARWPDHRQDLPRRDHQMERSGDRQAQSRRQTARHRDCRRAPLGRLRHHVHLDQLSLQGQPGMEEQGRREHRGRMAGRHRRQGQRRRLQQQRQTVGALGYVEYAYAKQNNLTYAKMINACGQDRCADRGGVPSRRRRRRLDQCAGFPRHHDERPRRQVVAGCRLDVHPDASHPGQRGLFGGGAEVLRLGLQERASRWRPTSTMFRCPTTSWR